MPTPRHCAALAAAGFSAAADAQQGPEPDWVSQFGTVEMDWATSVVPGDAGGLFCAGFTRGILGGPSTGDSAAFLFHAGARPWITQFGTVWGERAYALALDGAGGVFIGGYTRGDLAAPRIGGQDAFLARYDRDGTRLWITQFGTEDYEEVRALLPDGAGGVFAAGKTAGSLAGPGAGLDDAWLARYDASGARLWVAQFGSSGDDGISSLAPDGSGGFFASGSTDGALAGATAGGQDAFVTRYDGSGQRLWLKQFGTAEYETGVGLASDGAGGVFMTGRTSGSLGGPHAGRSDGYAMRLGPIGEVRWIIQFGGPETDYSYGAAPDGAGGVYLSGISVEEPGGPWVGWLARHSADGARIWRSRVGPPGVATPGALALDHAGGVLVSGVAYGDFGGRWAGDYDCFIARFGPDARCAADCDRSGALDLFDFLCFQSLFAAGDPGADCDESGALDVFDFLCFQDAFAACCP
ncbi:MAG: SBBP repeat-containing protein [Phycisphaerales bacterium JB039]